jgi:hypothetical protein
LKPNIEKKTVLSVSRRSDIPAFYLDWFAAGIKKGFFDVINPYNRRTSRVDARSRKVHSIVFWSKNFGPFLDGPCPDLLERMGYPLFFNFTITGAPSFLEPNLPPLPSASISSAGCAAGSVPVRYSGVSTPSAILSTPPVKGRTTWRHFPLSPARRQRQGSGAALPVSWTTMPKSGAGRRP